MSAPGDTPPLVYSADELVLLARLTRTPLPAAVDPAWPAADRAVADVVAARALLARGVLSLRSPGPGRAGGLQVNGVVAALLAPLRDATLALQIRVAGRCGVLRREVAVDGAGGGLRLVEREPDVWQLDRCADPVAVTLDALADGLATATGAPPVSFEVDRTVLDRTARQHRAGGTNEATESLRALGVPDEALCLWTTALATGEGEVSAQLARQVGTDHYTLGTVAWWNGEDAGVWRLDPAHHAGPHPATDRTHHRDHEPADEPPDTTDRVRVTGADPTELLADLQELMELADVASTEGVIR